MEQLSFVGTWILRNKHKKKIIALEKKGKLFSGNYYIEDSDREDKENLFWDDEGNAFEGTESIYKYYEGKEHFNKNRDYDLMERISSKFSRENYGQL